MILIVYKIEAYSLINKRLFPLISWKEWRKCFIISGSDSANRVIVVEMIFKPSVTFFKFHTKSIEKFPIRERGVNITNDDDIASEIEVRDDIFNLDLALYFYIKVGVPLLEVHMTTICSYLNLSYAFNSILFLP